MPACAVLFMLLFTVLMPDRIDPFSYHRNYVVHLGTIQMKGLKSLLGWWTIRGLCSWHVATDGVPSRCCCWLWLWVPWCHCCGGGCGWPGAPELLEGNSLAVQASVNDASWRRQSSCPSVSKMMLFEGDSLAVQASVN